MNAHGVKIALVTGANRGIGIAIVRGLCKQFSGDVCLLARDVSRGLAAVQELEKEGLHPKLHQLDITDQASIDRLADFIRSNYGGIDLLVNNAGIAYKGNSTAPFGEQAEVTMATNFGGTLAVCRTLFPLLRESARVVNVSSMSSQSALRNCSQELQDKFRDPRLEMNQLEDLMKQFVDCAKADTHLQQGWPNTAYGTSKIGVTVMTFIQQRQLDLNPDNNILVNSCCPGYVSTEMSSFRGPLTPDQGAVTPLYLALLSAGAKKPRGQFVKDQIVQKW